MVGIPDIRCVMRRQSKCLPASQSRLAPRTSHWRAHLQSRCLHAVGYHHSGAQTQEDGSPDDVCSPNKIDQNRSLLTVKNVALTDNCSERTICRAIDAGLLDVMRLGPGGRVIRIDPRAHNAYRIVDKA